MRRVGSSSALQRIVAWSAFLAAVFVTPDGRAAPDSTSVDDAGRTVSIAGPVRRVITLAPSLAELVDAVGAGPALIATVAHSD